MALLENNVERHRSHCDLCQVKEFLEICASERRRLLQIAQARVSNFVEVAPRNSCGGNFAFGFWKGGRNMHHCAFV